MKTALTLSAVALALIWIRRRRDRAELVEMAGRVGVWWEEELPG